MNGIYKTLFEQIEKAKTEAIKRGINANRIIIDEGLAYHEGFAEGFKLKRGDDNSPVKDSESYCLVKSDPMILGLAIKFQKDLKKELGLNFIIDDRAEPSKVEQLEAELERWKVALNVLVNNFEFQINTKASTPYDEDDIYIRILQFRNSDGEFNDIYSVKDIDGEDAVILSNCIKELKGEVE